MYLTKKVYVGANYEHNKVTGSISLKKGGKAIKINLKRVTNIEESVAYWRKANQIHNWFVKNVQEGQDDCKEYYVSKEQLQSLLDICQRIKKNPSLATTELPTKGGFFFGDTGYNENYKYDIENTIKMLKPILKDKSEGDFYYSSSW